VCVPGCACSVSWCVLSSCGVGTKLTLGLPSTGGARRRAARAANSLSCLAANSASRAFTSCSTYTTHIHMTPYHRASRMSKASLSHQTGQGPGEALQGGPAPRARGEAAHGLRPSTQPSHQNTGRHGTFRVSLAGVCECVPLCLPLSSGHCVLDPISLSVETSTHRARFSITSLSGSQCAASWRTSCFLGLGAFLSIARVLPSRD
jgi:hypothetical protein